MMPRELDATYRARAIPAGSVRHLSWVFAAAAARPPLLGVYALQAEWSALSDARTEPGAAQIKLGWWQEEMRRLTEAAPVHPISLYLMALPGAAPGHFAPLVDAIEAAAVEASGVPLERAADLEPHASRLRANPLRVAAALSAAATGPLADAANGSNESICALGLADYLARSLEDYRREARAGRVVFPVDELLAAGIDNAALAADEANPRLHAYLAAVRRRAADHYQRAAQVLPQGQRRTQRHLLVLAALGAAQLQPHPPHALKKLYLAWDAARRAVR